MRLLVLLFFSLSASANVPAQKLFLSFNNVKMSTALKKIGSVAKAKILFNLEDVQNYTVSAKIENKNVEEAMDIIISSKPFSYKVNDGFITVYKNARKVEPTHKLAKPEPAPQQGKKRGLTLSGIVISSEDNQPIVGVSIYVPGTSYGVLTDGNGRYTLTVPETTKTVHFRSIGFFDKKLNVEDRYLFQLVTMVEEVRQLDEAVVIGFGSKQKKESVVGAITSVKPSDLALTSNNLTTGFAGNIAGIIARQSSGEPGYDSPYFYIRGVSTFGANNSALLILDGVEITSSMLGQIAPETIQSFSVLKDATATALYGSRGANGVIIITTKSGHQSEKMNIKLRFESSISMPTNIQKIADGATYMKAYNEAVKNSADDSGAEYKPFYSDDKIAGTEKHLNPYVFPDNDWYHMLFRNYSINRNLNLNVTGGSKYLDYFLNAAISDEDGIVKQPKESPYDINLNFKKFLFQSNVSANITKTTRVSLKMNTQLMYNHRPYQDISDLFYYTMRANPVRFPATLPAQSGDTYTRYGNNNSWDTGYTDLNPYALLSSGYGERYYSYLTSVFSLDQKFDFITKGLSGTLLASFYNYTYSSSYGYFTPFYYKVLDDYTIGDGGAYNYNTESIGSAGSTYTNYSVGRDGLHEYSFQGKIDYARTFGKHDVTAMFVYHMKEKKLNIASTENDILPYREQGFAGRVTYNFDKRYFAECDLGYNGSENFAKGHRWGFFPSVAVGYMISNEAFFEPLKKIVNTFKLRASYGLAGNDYLDSRFPYLTTVNMSVGTGWYVGSGFSQVYGPQISFYGNEGATWEKAKKFNCGVDLKILNDFSLTVDVYDEKRTGIFMQRASLPSTVGLSGTTPYGNVGKVNKHGIELSAEYNHAANKDFFYSLRGTFTYSQNAIKNIDEPPILTYPYTSKVGHSICSYYGLIADGLFGSKEEIANSPKQNFGNYSVGDIKYRDLNGDGVIDNNDVTAIGKPYIPEVIYGFGGSLKFHCIDFSVMFQGAGSLSLYMHGMDPFCDSSHFGYGIAQYIVDNHYSADNPNVNALYPRLTSVYNSNNVQESTHWIKNANYLRLKSIEVGYTYRSFRFSLSGYNLFYLSPFKYWDPEKGGGDGLSYPIQRSVKLGVQYEF